MSGKASNLIDQFLTQKIDLAELKATATLLSFDPKWDVGKNKDEMYLLLTLNLFLLGFETHVDTGGTDVSDDILRDIVGTVFGKIIYKYNTGLN